MEFSLNLVMWFTFLPFANPPVSLEDRYRLPSSFAVQEAVVFSNVYGQHLSWMKKHEISEYKMVRWQEMISENNQLQYTWQLLGTIQDPGCNDERKFNALLELRDRIGHENYMAGVMPPNVPFWRFGER